MFYSLVINTLALNTRISWKQTYAIQKELLSRNNLLENKQKVCSACKFYDRDAKANGDMGNQGKTSEKLSIAVVVPQGKGKQADRCRMSCMFGVASMIVFLSLVLSWK